MIIYWSMQTSHNRSHNFQNGGKSVIITISQQFAKSSSRSISYRSLRFHHKLRVFNKLLQKLKPLQIDRSIHSMPQPSPSNIKRTRSETSASNLSETSRVRTLTGIKLNQDTQTRLWARAAHEAESSFDSIAPLCPYP